MLTVDLIFLCSCRHFVELSMFDVALNNDTAVYNDTCFRYNESVHKTKYFILNHLHFDLMGVNPMIDRGARTTETNE